MSRLVLLTAALALAPLASAEPLPGVVFREIEVIGSGTPPRTTRQVRRVFTAAGKYKSLVEESSDPLAAAGSYVLGNGDAFLFDPSTKTVTPVDPVHMEAAGEAPPPERLVSNVTLERRADSEGPLLLGLPSWHYVYFLSYDETPDSASDSGEALHAEERHELWAVSWPGDQAALDAWRELRIAEDGGAGAARREIRVAIGRLYEHGLLVRHIIDRSETMVPPAHGTDTERVDREITELSRAELSDALFVRPEGFAPTEFLAPARDAPAPAPRPATEE